MIRFRPALLKVTVSALALATAGCIHTPNPAGLKLSDVPAQFDTKAPPNAPVWPSVTWWSNFGSPELTEMEGAAQTDNLDMAAAAARVLEADASSGVARAPLFPNLTGSFTGERGSGRISTTVTSGTGGTGGTGTGGTGTGGTGTGTTSTTIVGNTFGATLDASYALDLFGELHAQYRAAVETLRSSRYAQQTVALTTEATVATTYLDVLALRERVTIAKQNIAAAQRILAITQAKVTNGVSSNLDLAQQKAQVEAQEATVPVLEQQVKTELYALAVLLGRPPEGFDVKAQNLNGLAPPIIGPGLPSELLRRRPDVAEAEAALYSAHANVDAARAAFFPQITLTGSAGQSANKIQHLFNSSNFVWSLGGELLQTIFDGGLLSSESDLAKATQLELIADYRKSAISAFSDVENSLGNTSSLAEQERLVTAEVADAQEAFRIAELQYREGVADLLLVLQTQQTLFTAQDELVQIKLSRLQAVVGLYQALGGGWIETADGTPATPPSGPIETSADPVEPPASKADQ
ncbi:MAG TPA: efflux transporter outer membrane subunit [Rhizomicrobium sp.]|jgi:NodT family efflux transporter outer membrane factor (OMF) lipoprotein